jgi:diguanylate cyclase (GGDEF)-like protein/PAS domain S-box-containing protein
MRITTGRAALGSLTAGWGRPFRRARARGGTRIWQKLAVIGFALLLPLAITAGLLVNESTKRLTFIDNELRGLDYVQPLYVLLLDLSVHRDFSRQVIAGTRPAADLEAATEGIDDDYAALVAIDQKVGRELDSAGSDLNQSATVAGQLQEWNRWKTTQHTAASDGVAHDVMIAQVRALIDHIGLTSNLTIDPAPDSYRLAKALITQVPALTDETMLLGTAVDQMLEAGPAFLDRARAAAIVTSLGQRIDELQSNLYTAVRHLGNNGASSALTVPLQSAHTAIATLNQVTTRDFVQSSPVVLDRPSYDGTVFLAANALRVLWNAILDQEHQLLNNRHAGYVEQNLVSLGSVLLALALTVAFVGLTSRRIATDIGTVARAAAEFAGGDLTRRVRVRSRDEVGALAAAFNNMAERMALSQHRLRAERDFSGALVDVAGSLVLVLDRKGRIVRFNRACEATTGYRSEDVTGRAFWDVFVPADDVDATRMQFTEGVAANDFPNNIESTWIARDGTPRYIAWFNGALVDDGGRVEHVIASGIDITARRVAETELGEARERFQQAFDNAMTGMCLVGLDLRFMQVNPALCTMLGYTSNELIGRTMLEITHPDDKAEALATYRALLSGEKSTVDGERRYIRADGGVVRALVSGAAVSTETGGPMYFVTQIEDVTERRANEEKLVHQALHDPLTGLPNRAMFMDQLRAALTHAETDHGVTALLFIDLDGFKAINDSLGHDAGDQVLRRIAHRLRRGLRRDDIVARVGGDEFVILCRQLPTEHHSQDTAERLLPMLATPVEIAGAEAVLTASIGIAISTQPTTDPEELIRDADAAMYHAKARGKNRYEVFDDILRARTLDRVAIETAIRRGLREGGFRLDYQPIVDLPTGCLIGVESLLRLEDPDRGELAPDAFMKVAEETGLIVPVGAWVLSTACAQLAEWQATGAVPPWLKTTVNLSFRQVASPDLVDTVVTALAESKLDRRCLALELTETILIEADAASLRQLQDIRDMGVQLGIDDFGTGYSSLTYLKRLPVSFIKIDRSFVAEMVQHGSDREIVASVIGLGKSLGLTTIAEGVENAEQLHMLVQLGCDLAQGYLFGRPRPDVPRLEAEYVALAPSHGTSTS